MKRFISIFFASMLSLSCFFTFAFADNPDNAQYYTSDDVHLFNSTRSNIYNTYLASGMNPSQASYLSLIMACDQLGFPEVPVAGAQRSDYVSPTVTDPDGADIDPDSNQDSNLEGGVKFMAEMLASMTLVFTEVMKWTGTVGTTIEGTPLLLAMAVISVGSIGITFFIRLLKLR